MDCALSCNNVHFVSLGGYLSLPIYGKLPSTISSLNSLIKLFAVVLFLQYFGVRVCNGKDADISNLDI